MTSTDCAFRRTDGQQSQQRAFVAFMGVWGSLVWLVTVGGMLPSLRRLGELRSMRCRQINFVSGTITLETSKNGEPREAFMTAAVRELLAALVAGKKPEDFVFAKPLKKRRKKQERSQLKDFRKTWATVCVEAEVGALHCPACDEKIDVTAERPYQHCGREWRRCDLTYRGLIFHDLRRCAVRGLMRAGVAQKTAMTITGHKTISVFQRYHIIAPSELK